MYVKFNNNPRDNDHAGDCVIRAISIVTGESWSKIYTELCIEGFYYGDWGSNNAVWDSYLLSKGFKRYVCPNECSSCYTVKDFAADNSTGSYIIATGSHAVAIVYGNYLDAFDSGEETVLYYYVKE